MQAIIALVGAVLAAYLTQAWISRRDVSKRRLEFFEEVLALFYESRAAIVSARYWLGWSTEGSTRHPGEHETEDETRDFNRIYSPIERLTKKSEIFSQLNSKRFKFKAMARGDSDAAFDEINKILSEMDAAARMLIDGYRSRNDSEQQREFIQSREQILWAQTVKDPIDRRLNEAVSLIEKNRRS